MNSVKKGVHILLSVYVDKKECVDLDAAVKDIEKHMDCYDFLVEILDSQGVYLHYVLPKLMEVEEKEALHLLYNPTVLVVTLIKEEIERVKECTQKNYIPYDEFMAVLEEV